MPTSASGDADASDCLVLVGDRKLRNELMLRSFCFRNDPIRPLRADEVSLVGDSSFASGTAELAPGEYGLGASQLGASFSFRLGGHGWILEIVSMVET
jgi:hypothetical protein